MTARILWLGNAPLIEAQRIDLASLPSVLAGELVVHPTPLEPDAAAVLLADVTRRGGRLAIELGTEPPVAEGVFQFSQDACLPHELRQQFEALRVDRSIALPSEAHFTFRSYAKVEVVAHAVSALLPKPGQRIVGLVELLLNACEHGNLAVRREEKQALLVSGQWLAELDRRERTAPWAGREVHVEYRRDANACTVVITDEGAGFDFRDLCVPGKLHGRGVCMARKLSFDSVEFEGRGNRVVAKVRR